MSEAEDRSFFAQFVILLVISLIGTAAILGGLEGAARLFSLGEPDASRSSRLKYQQIHFPILIPSNRPDGTAVLRTADKRLPRQSLLAEKPKNSIRVIAFGGSATAGLGFSPNVTFAKYLERMLVLAHPDLEVEVLQLGIVALSSRQVKHLVAYACENLDPDVLIVYSGNNEFLEPHAKKYADAHASAMGRVADLLRNTNLFRLLNHMVRGAPRTPSLADQDFSHDDLRMTQHEIIKDIKMSEREIEEILDRYERNIEEAAEVALRSSTPIILLSVASNWEWRGRESLDPSWIDELVKPDSRDLSERYREAIGILDLKIATAALADRHEWLFRRALARRALGRDESARDDFRAAMNVDPHLRRSLDSMADRVRSVASQRNLPFLDTIEFLTQRTEDGVVGFDEFYDYVHFTPRGAALVAMGIFEAMRREGFVPPSDFDSEAYLQKQLQSLESLSEDAMLVDDWMGFGFDPELIHDRDLWKYDRMVKDLSVRIESNPRDLRALIYRGNANFFRIGGSDDAERDYRAALELDASRNEVRVNLEMLLSEGDL